MVVTKMRTSELRKHNKAILELQFKDLKRQKTTLSASLGAASDNAKFINQNNTKIHKQIYFFHF